MSKIGDAYLVELLARAVARGGARTPDEVVKIAAKCGIQAPRAKRVAVDAGWPSLEALHASAERAGRLASGWDPDARPGQSKPTPAKDDRVPVEVATLYLDHPSADVRAQVRVIADDYRKLERLVGESMVKPEPHPDAGRSDA
ncbi:MULTISPECIES: hypothetical protein [unclassified Luteococcus]|uniref:hypothetical protein n=1 Tax=unclassified Luteococcus TaxID=2639923 RepID=UPI00313C9C19